MNRDATTLGGDTERCHNGDQNRRDDSVAAAKRAEKTADDDRANDKRDFGFGLRVDANAFDDPVDHRTADARLGHKDAEACTCHDNHTD